MRILVVEDEKRIADFICRGLEGAGYAVDPAPTGTIALDQIHSTDYDLVVLDLMLPDVDGLQVLEKIRNRKVGPPVLILSARGALDDRVKGLEQGADDYLVKPFAFVEFLARVRALLRRGAVEAGEKGITHRLDLDATKGRELFAHDGVVARNECSPLSIAESNRARRRVDDISEQNGGENPI